MPVTGPAFRYTWLLWATAGLAFGMYWSSVFAPLSWRHRDVAVVRAVLGNGWLAR